MKLSRSSHAFDDDQSIYDQIRVGMVFVTRSFGHVGRVTHVDEDGDEITLTYDSSGEDEILSGEEMERFWSDEAFAVPVEVLSDPQGVVFEYALFKLGRDLETIGRSHAYSVAGSERVSDIEFALWAVDEARDGNWPPDDAAGVYIGEEQECDR